MSNLLLIEEIHVHALQQAKQHFTFSWDNLLKCHLYLPPFRDGESATYIFMVSMWLSLRLYFTSACLVTDSHTTCIAVQTTFPTSDFLGHWQCFQHREHNNHVPMPSSVGVTKESCFSTPNWFQVIIVFNGGLLELEFEGDVHQHSNAWGPKDA